MNNKIKLMSLLLVCFGLMTRKCSWRRVSRNSRWHQVKKLKTWRHSHRYWAMELLQAAYRMTYPRVPMAVS